MAGNNLVDFATEHLVSLRAFGSCPHGVVAIPFGELNEPSNLFPAPNYKSLTARLTGEASAGAIRVVTQQLRT